MATGGGISRAAQDFFRSANQTALPDGTTDNTDAISRQGRVAITPGMAADPVAVLDVARQARTGNDPRTAESVFYTTGNLGSGLNYSWDDATFQANIGYGRAEIRHTNQSQGIGFGYDTIYATGYAANADLVLRTRGNGTFSTIWPVLNGPYHYDERVGIAARVSGSSTGFLTRYWRGNAVVAQVYTDFADIGAGGRFQWDLRGGAGSVVPGMRLRPANDGVNNTNNTELYVGENQVHNRKLVLYDGGAGDTSFYGFGINASTFRYQTPNVTSVHSFFQGASEQIRFDASGIVIFPTAAPPAATIATDTPLMRNPTTGRITAAPAGSQIKRRWSGTAVTDAAGNFTVNFPAGRFVATPVCVITPGPSANKNLVDSRITALSAASVSGNVQQSLSVTLLAIKLLAAKVPANGVTVQIQAEEAG